MFKFLLISLALLLGCGEDSNFSSSAPVVNLTEDDFVTMEFKAGQKREVRIKLSRENENVRQQITMSEPKRSKLSWLQEVRERRYLKKVQGSLGIDREEVFKLREAGKLDLLIVMDDSSSMFPYQEKIQSRFQILLDDIADLDWRLAVATTSSSCLRESPSGAKFLRSSDYQRQAELVLGEFKSMITPGEFGNPIERGILMASEALAGDCARIPWTRDDSQKVVLIVTDEKNCGSASNEGCRSQDYSKAEFFLDRAPTDTRVFGLFHFKDNPECPSSGGYENMYPSEYERLVNLSGGFADEICQLDYARVLTRLADEVQDKLVRSFELKYEPVLGSVEINLDGRQLSEREYSVKGRKIVLEQALGDLESEVRLSYRHGASKMFDRVEVDRNIDPDSLLVFIDNRAIEASEFYYEKESSQIIFKTTPEQSAEVEFVYRLDEGLKSEFSLTVPGELFDHKVTVAGVETKAYRYDPTWQKIIFESEPEDGAKIDFYYSLTSELPLEYPLTVVSHRDLSAQSLYSEDYGQVDLSERLNEGSVKFLASEYKPGRLWLLEFLSKNSGIGAVKLALPDLFIDGSLGIHGQEGCASNWRIVSGFLLYECFLASEQDLEISYSHYEGYTNEFLVDPQGLWSDQWFVRVNGSSIDTFSVEAGRLIIDEQYIKPGDRVSVRVRKALY